MMIIALGNKAKIWIRKFKIKLLMSMFNDLYNQ